MSTSNNNDVIGTVSDVLKPSVWKPIFEDLCNRIIKGYPVTPEASQFDFIRAAVSQAPEIISEPEAGYFYSKVTVFGLKFKAWGSKKKDCNMMACTFHAIPAVKFPFEVGLDYIGVAAAAKDWLLWRKANVEISVCGPSHLPQFVCKANINGRIHESPVFGRKQWAESYAGMLYVRWKATGSVTTWEKPNLDRAVDVDSAAEDMSALAIEKSVDDQITVGRVTLVSCLVKLGGKISDIPLLWKKTLDIPEATREKYCGKRDLFTFFTKIEKERVNNDILIDLVHAGVVSFMLP